MGKPPIYINYKKLGREKRDGQAWKDDRVIDIDPRLKGFDLLETLVHEIQHVQFPKWGEHMVIGRSKELAELLWQQGYRKVDL